MRHSGMRASSASKDSWASEGTRRIVQVVRISGSSSSARRAMTFQLWHSWKSWAHGRARLRPSTSDAGRASASSMPARSAPDTPKARELREKLDPLMIKHSPLSIPVKKPKATWLKPVALAEISFGGVTEDGVLREAVFKRLVDDVGPVLDDIAVARTEKPARRASSRPEGLQAPNVLVRQPTKSERVRTAGRGTNSGPLLI